MSNILIIGGTRNLGYFLVNDLLMKGHNVTVLNRGQTLDQLPASVERLHADRRDFEQLKNRLQKRTFDAVVDTTLYNGKDAQSIVKLLNGYTGHYIFLSTGQVYLVRTGISRPFREEDYIGSVMDPPVNNKFDYENWLYGIEKRQAEDVFSGAWESKHFPVTSLRLPMVNSERDHFNRILGYVLRLKDEGPILVPKGSHLLLRHVYGMDVIQAIIKLIEDKNGCGLAFNISQEETLSLEEFLSLLARLLGCSAKIVFVERNLLESRQLIPDCSPFSDPWMSELDNLRSKIDLKMEYTPLPVYLKHLITYYQHIKYQIPVGYQRRQEEIEIGLRKKH